MFLSSYHIGINFHRTYTYVFHECPLCEDFCAFNLGIALASEYQIKFSHFYVCECGFICENCGIAYVIVCAQPAELVPANRLQNTFHVQS